MDFSFLICEFSYASLLNKDVWPGTRKLFTINELNSFMQVFFITGVYCTCFCYVLPVVHDLGIEKVVNFYFECFIVVYPCYAETREIVR
jgi:hypothetical protein